VIIARSPFRMSLGGGGTDLPSYYRDYGGFLIAAAIDKSMYVSAHRTFGPQVVVRYAKIERVDSPSEIAHPIVREALKLLGFTERSLEITSMADIPAGTGLGSSASFCTALLKALYRLRNQVVTPEQLAIQACHIEIDLLGEPTGKQDQYVAAYGGLNCYEFYRDDTVVVTPLNLRDETLGKFAERVLLFSTGMSRQAPEILRAQDDGTRQGTLDMLDNLHMTKQIGYESRRTLELGDLDAYGRLLHEHWQHKKKRSTLMTNGSLDRWYEVALANGATGGKVIGAGGGGFFMFYATDPSALRRALEKEGLAELRFSFDFEGCRIL
jgi:D-glycero-alpha-D-manno-heptose-7-phosphate kinase